MGRGGWVAVVVLAGACNPTYAPPVRSSHGGAPRRAFGPVAVDLSAVLIAIPGLAVRIPLHRQVGLELGGEVTEVWRMAFAGVRVTQPVGPDGPRQFGAVDLEVGAGIGSGGENGALDDGARPTDPVNGAYVGAGFGTHGDGWGGFVRGRVQASDADSLPRTTWTSGMIGVQFGSERVRFRAAGGVVGYSNRVDAEAGPFFELGLELAAPSRP